MVVEPDGAGVGPPAAAGRIDESARSSHGAILVLLPLLCQMAASVYNLDPPA